MFKIICTCYYLLFIEMSKKLESPAVIEASEISFSEQNSHRSRVSPHTDRVRPSPGGAENAQSQAMIPPKLAPPPGAQSALSSQPASNIASNSKHAAEPVSGKREPLSLDAESELAEKQRLVRLCLESQNTLDGIDTVQYINLSSRNVY